MTEVTERIFKEEAKLFFDKHGNDYEERNSCEDTDEFYRIFFFKDGSCWCEKYTDVYEKGNTEIHGIKIEVDVKLQKVEYWSTESKIKYFYLSIEYK